ncbi:MAG: outer membrane protein assembly factor BamE [Pseudomonadales bacterium]|nr:outer membrane protein assembly factor BamE [Pseudomonadales bacterium]MCP5347081.1 outer membrane protein assembly factor BamE [Pseudomonadales bacterium]
MPVTAIANTTFFRALLLIAVLSSLSACGPFQFPGVYKISIPQGNILTQDMVDQLRPGMTKRQVIFVMGTPLVRDPFHQDRWDYVYNFQPGGGQRVGERVTVYFESDQLVRITGDYQPNPDAVN